MSLRVNNTPAFSEKTIQLENTYCLNFSELILERAPNHDYSTKGSFVQQLLRPNWSNCDILIGKYLLTST